LRYRDETGILNPWHQVQWVRVLFDRRLVNLQEMIDESIAKKPQMLEAGLTEEEYQNAMTLLYNLLGKQEGYP